MKRTVRVLNVFHTLMPSGAEVMWRNAASAFKDLGIEHIVVSVDSELGPYSKFLAEQFEIVHVPLGPGPWGGFALARAAKRFKADVIHCHSESKAVAACFAGLVAGIRVVRTYHNIWSTRNLRHRLRRVLESRFSTRVAVGASVQKTEEFWGPTLLILNWANGGQPNRLQSLDNRQKLLTVCNTGPLKQCELMIEMLKIHDEWDLTHVGYDPLGQFSEVNLSSHGLSKRVRTLGPRNDVLEIMPTYGAYLCTSIREGFSIALTEALLTGLPLAIVDNPGVRDITEFMPYAYLVEPESEKPLKGLQESIGKQEEEYKRALPTLREAFSEKRGAREYADLYRRLSRS
jgi:glycosyltransferase involved in cell wall biosynthesis